MMKPALVYPWSLVNADGSKAAMTGFAWGRLQAHEMAEFKKLNPDAEATLHVCLNSTRSFGGVWRARDATQVAPAPDAPVPWPILHRTEGAVPEVFYDLRERRVQVDAVEWLISRWSHDWGLLMLDDVQLRPSYLPLTDRGGWADAWLRIVYRLRAEGYRLGVNLWPLSSDAASDILTLCETLMIERFAPPAVPRLLDLSPRILVLQWIERRPVADIARRTAALIVEHASVSSEVAWAVDDGAGRQYHPDAVGAIEPTT